MIRAELVLLAWAAATSEAFAATVPARAVIDACAEGPVAPAALSRLLPLELAAGGVRLVETATAAELLLTISVPGCGPAAQQVALAALELSGGGRVGRTLHLTPEPGGARVVAVAMAELIRELPPRPSAPPATRTASVAPVARPLLVLRPVRPAPGPRGSAPPPPAWSLTLGAHAYPGMASAQASLAAGLELSALAPARLEAGLALRYGLERDLRGKIDLGALAAYLALGARLELAPLELGLGPRLVVGWAFASGRPGSLRFEGRRVDALLAELWLDLRLGWRLDPHLSIGAVGSTGYVLSGLIAQADGEDITGVEGVALGLAFFGAYRF